uniref:Uncharacterized protein n=1 Tax=Oryza meridionalis TaxID=40149 RepID=A0A0E0C473_9ORYZ
MSPNPNSAPLCSSLPVSSQFALHPPRPPYPTILSPTTPAYTYAARCHPAHRQSLYNPTTRRRRADGRPPATTPSTSGDGERRGKRGASSGTEGKEEGDAHRGTSTRGGGREARTEGGERRRSSGEDGGGRDEAVSRLRRRRAKEEGRPRDGETCGRDWRG